MKRFASCNSPSRRAVALALVRVPRAGSRAQDPSLPAAAGDVQTLVFNPWCEKIGKESGGRLKCQIYPSMQLGGTPPQLFDQARDGVADIIWTVPTYQAGRFLKSEVFELPFMAKNAEIGSPALWEYVQKNSLDEFKGAKLLAMHLHDGALLHFSNKQVKTMDELKGLKVRGPTRIGAQVPDGAGRGARADAAAAGARVDIEGRHRRRDGAVGRRAADQAAGDRQVPPRHGGRRRRGCRTRSSSSR